MTTCSGEVTCPNIAFETQAEAHARRIATGRGGRANELALQMGNCLGRRFDRAAALNEAPFPHLPKRRPPIFMLAKQRARAFSSSRRSSKFRRFAALAALTASIGCDSTSPGRNMTGLVGRAVPFPPA